jgi:hypothetical protein
MVLSVLLVVVWMTLVPVFLAITLVGLIVRIECELFFLPFALTGPLTVFIAAITLIHNTGIRCEKAFTMGGRTLNLFVHGFAPVEAKTINS